LTAASEQRTLVESGFMTMKNALTLVVVSVCLTGFARCRPPAAQPGIRLGVSASMEGRWDEAVALFSKALAANPSSAAAHNNLAVAYEKKGLWDEAAKHYEAALKLDPANVLIQDNYRGFRENREALLKKPPVAEERR
jgi:Tfp pilus assembly protein PilF